METHGDPLSQIGHVMAGIRRLWKEQMGQKEGADKVLPPVRWRLPYLSFEPFSEFGKASSQEILMFFLPLLVQKPDSFLRILTTSDFRTGQILSLAMLPPAGWNAICKVQQAFRRVVLDLPQFLPSRLL